MKRANPAAGNSVSLSLLEDALDEHNTTVEEETEKEIAYYQRLRDQTKDATEKAKIDALLDTLSSIKGRSSSGSLPKKSMADDTAIGLVNAFFNMKGYKLSSELLLHAKANASVDSIYSPVHGNLIE